MPDYTVVQSERANSTSTLNTVGFDASPGTNNLLLAEVVYDNTVGTVPALSGPNGAVWSRASQDADSTNNETVELWYCLSSITGANGTVAVTASGSLAGASITIAEISRADGKNWTFIQASAAKAFASTTTGTDTDTSNAITTSAGTFVASGVSGTGGKVGTWTAGTAFTLIRADTGTSATGNTGLEWVEGTAGSISATWNYTLTTDRYTSRIFEFGPTSIVTPNPPAIPQTDYSQFPKFLLVR